MSEKLKFYLVVYWSSLLAIILSYVFIGLICAILVFVVVVVSAFFTIKIFNERYSKKNKIFLYSLQIAASGLSAYSFNNYLYKNIIYQFLKQYFPSIESTYEQLSPYLFFSFLVIVIFIVNYFSRDRTILGVYNKELDEDVKRKTFREMFKQVSDALNDELSIINRNSNWNAKYFVPLKAKVEVSQGDYKKRRILNLLNAIKKSKDSVLLVLGDPGSGKSVSLRKLTQELLVEAPKTLKMPIYVNLKEWMVDEKWTESTLPTVNDLNEYIYNDLIGRDIIIGNFFKKYYDKLYNAGRLYFVLDSFDEIPSVLDEKENSEIIKKLSDVIYRFLRGASSEGIKGILASRLYRRPISAFDSTTVLEILPFTEGKIISMLKNNYHFESSLIKKIFKERLDLVSIAKNPFSATLLSEYINNNDNAFPESQTKMYSDYIERVLSSSKEKIEKRGLNEYDVKMSTIKIAEKMFHNGGLEIKMSDLRKDLPNVNVDSVVEILKYSRLGRGGINDESKFSFVHRRFAEYFAVQNLIIKNEKINLNAIPQDSQWRDALVLYSEVVEYGKAVEMAEYCYDFINKRKNPLDIEVIHTLRFLRDAFKVRVNVLKNIQNGLYDYIHDIILNNNNILANKLVVEALGLVGDDKIDECIVLSMKSGISWINETCIRSCRHMSKITKELEGKMFEYIDSMAPKNTLYGAKEMLFSLSLSDSFKKVKRYYLLSLFSLIFNVISVLLLLLFSPKLFLYLSISTFLFYITFSHKHLIFGDKKYDFMVHSPYEKLRILYLLNICMALFSAKYSFLKSDLLHALCISLSLLFMIPFYKVYKYDLGNIYKVVNLFVKGFLLAIKKENIFVVLKKIFVVLIASVVVLSIGIILNYFIDFLSATIYVRYILFALTIVVGIVVLGRIISEYILVYRELRMVKKYKTKDIYSREKIYQTIQEIKTAKGMDAFLLFLENNIKAVNGVWPDNKYFEKDSNHFNVRLAILEEKWLGLAR